MANWIRCEECGEWINPRSDEMECPKCQATLVSYWDDPED